MDSSPAQRLMSRRLKTSIPVTDKLLEPAVVTGIMEKLRYRRQLAKSFYDQSARVLPELEVGKTVRMRPLPGDTSCIWKAGTCLSKVAPRSYLVNMDGSIYRRNRVDRRVAESGTALGFEDGECVPVGHSDEGVTGNEMAVISSSPARPSAGSSPATATPAASSVTVRVGEGLVRTRAGCLTRPPKRLDW